MQPTICTLKASNGNVISQGQMPTGKFKKFCMNRFFRAIDPRLQRKMNMQAFAVEKNDVEVTVQIKSKDSGKKEVVENPAGAVNLQSNIVAILNTFAGASLGALCSGYPVTLYENAMASMHKGHDALVSLGIGTGVFLLGIAVGLIYSAPAKLGRNYFMKAVSLEKTGQN